MRNRLLTVGFAATVLVAGLSAALAAEGSLGNLSLADAAPVATLNVPCAGSAANSVANSACNPDAPFLSAPVAALSATPSGGAATTKLSQSLSLTLGGASLMPLTVDSAAPSTSALLESQSRPLEKASFAGMNWNVTPWASLGVIAAQTTANDPFDRQALSALVKASQSLGANASARLGDNWVTTVSYDQGTSQLNLRAGSLLGGDDDLLHNRSYSLSIAKRGLFGDNDSLDLGITRKLQSYATGIDLSGGDMFATGAFTGNNALTVPETDFEVGYVTTFLDGALALQANAAYQTNVAGQNGQNSLTVLSRAKFNF